MTGDMNRTLQRLHLPIALLTLAGCLSGAEAPGSIEVHGHRGARASRPENTIPAFEFAISAGADVLELDMSVTKDNVIVISHDPVLHPPVCSGPQARAIIHNLTLEELKQWDCGAIRNPGFPDQQTIPGTRMPTLDEVFALASKGKFRFNIETKIMPRRVNEAELTATLKRVGVDPESPQGKDVRATMAGIGPDVTPPPDEFARMVLEKVRQYHLENRVILQSFDFRTLHAMKKLAPEIQLSALYGGQARDFVEIAREAGAQIVSPTYQLVTVEQVKAAHAAGLQVIPWTANKPEDWDRLIAAGVDAIITDDPAGLIRHLKR